MSNKEYLEKQKFLQNQQKDQGNATDKTRQELIEKQRKIKEELELYIQKIDSFPTGIQVLRELIRYDSIGEFFITQCKQVDKSEDKNDRTIDFSKLDTVLIKSLKEKCQEKYSPFIPEDIQQICKEAPLKTISKNNNRDNVVLVKYQLLFDAILKSPPPKTNYCMQNLDFNDSDRYKKLSEIQEEFKKYQINIYDYFGDSNFRESDNHYNLHQLEVQQLKSDWNQKQVELEKEEEKKDKQTNKIQVEIINRKKTTQKQYYFQQQNNKHIIDNFKVYIANDIINAIKPKDFDSYMFQDEIIEHTLKQQFKMISKDKIQTLTRQRFIKIVQEAPCMQENFPFSEFSENEYSLLYFLIWSEFEFKVFTINLISDFIKKYRYESIKQLKKLQTTEEEKEALRGFVGGVPKLYKYLIDLMYQNGRDFLFQGFMPLQEEGTGKEKWVDVTNLKLYFNSMCRNMPSNNEINDLKIFLSKEKVIIKDNRDRHRAQIGTLYLDLKALEKKLQQEMAKQEKDIIEKGKQIKRDIHQSRNLIQAKIVENVVENLINRMKIYADKEGMIEEIKFRQLINEQFQEIQADDLDSFIKLVGYKQMSYSNAKLLNMNEFKNFMLQGKIFSDQGQEKIEDDEETKKKLKELNEIIKKDEKIEKKLKKKYLNQQISSSDSDKEEEEKIFSFEVPKFKTQKEDPSLLLEAEVLSDLFKLVLKDFTSKDFKLKQIGEVDQIELVMYQFNKLLKAKDLKNENTIRSNDLLEVFQENFPKLGTGKIKYLLKYAQKYCRIEENLEEEFDHEISYNFLSLTITKSLILNLDKKKKK